MGSFVVSFIVGSLLPRLHKDDVSFDADMLCSLYSGIIQNGSPDEHDSWLIENTVSGGTWVYTVDCWTYKCTQE